MSNFDAAVAKDGIERSAKNLDLRDRDEDARKTRKYLKILETHGIFEMAAGLKSLGINYYDYNQDNLMMRGDKVIMIDPGRSKGGAGRIDAVESAKRIAVDWMYRRRMMLLK